MGRAAAAGRRDVTRPGSAAGAARAGKDLRLPQAAHVGPAAAGTNHREPHRERHDAVTGVGSRARCREPISIVSRGRVGCRPWLIDHGQHAQAINLARRPADETITSAIRPSSRARRAPGARHDKQLEPGWYEQLCHEKTCSQQQAGWWGKAGEHTMAAMPRAATPLQPQQRCPEPLPARPVQGPASPGLSPELSPAGLWQCPLGTELASVSAAL